MNGSKGGVLNSPAFRANNASRRLDSDSLLQLPGAAAGAIEHPAEQASHRSKRSLSINTNRVAKVIKLGDDTKSAISKVRQPQRNASIGHPLSGNTRNAAPQGGIYQSGVKLNKLQLNSTEDLKSQAS